MAKPRSESKRNDLLAAATRVIVVQGLSASTATIAKAAGVATGSLFTYFETKAQLFNELYLDLKADMATAAIQDVEPNADLHTELLQAWTNWMAWAVANPGKRRALAQLGVSEEITATTRTAAHETMAGLARLMERARADGPMKAAPMELAAAIMNSLAETTMDFMVQDPIYADEHCHVGFNALWRVLT